MKSEFEERESEYNIAEKKIQTTLYIGTNLLDKIEEKWLLIRQKLPRSKRGKFTKSKFYELIIETVTADDKQLSKIVSKWEQS